MNGEKMIAYIGIVFLTTPYGWCVLAGACVLVGGIFEEIAGFIGVDMEPSGHYE